MFKGSIVALITPMDEGGAVDLSAFQALIESVLAGGSDGLVVAGTTGESATLEPGEYQALLETAVAQVRGRAAVLAGTGSPSTASAIARTRLAATLGADGALVVTPSYNRPMPSGLEAHYTAIARAVDLPLVLYNVPSRTGVDLPPTSVARLAHLPSVVGIKEAVPGAERAGELVACCEGRLTVLSGDDDSCLEAMEAGAEGVVSVAANLAPAHFSRMVGLAQTGQLPAARAVHTVLQPLLAQLAVETNPIPVKWGACELGLAGPGIRLPLLPLEEPYRPGLRACLEQLGLMPGMEPSF